MNFLHSEKLERKQKKSTHIHNTNSSIEKVTAIQKYVVRSIFDTQNDKKETFSCKTSKGEIVSSQWTDTKRVYVGHKSHGKWLNKWKDNTTIFRSGKMLLKKNVRIISLTVLHRLFQINELSHVNIPVMLLPDDFRAYSKIKVDNHLFNK